MTRTLRKTRSPSRRRPNNGTFDSRLRDKDLTRLFAGLSKVDKKWGSQHVQKFAVARAHRACSKRHAVAACRLEP